MKVVNTEQIRGTTQLHRTIPITSAFDTCDRFEMGEMTVEFETAQYFDGNDLGRIVSISVSGYNYTGVIQRIEPIHHLYASENRTKILLRSVHPQQKDPRSVVTITERMRPMFVKKDYDLLTMLRLSFSRNVPVDFPVYGYGVVTALSTKELIDGVFEVSYTIRPTDGPRSTESAEHIAKRLVEEYAPKDTLWWLNHLGEFELILPENTRMKIYEGIVVKLDAEQQEPVSIEKVIAPFLAKDAKSARESVLVDFATLRAISGKDLTGYSIRVREFQAAAC